MKFTIKTNSTFENVYVVEANTLDDAIEIVMNEKDPPDFYQKHLGESVVSTEEKSYTHDELRKQGYF